jgi:hypothetical protein
MRTDDSMRWDRNVYKVLMGKPEGKRSLGRPTRRWKDGFRTSLKTLAGEGVWSVFSWLRTGIGGGLLLTR